MDAQLPEDLNDLEQRLAGWQPSRAGLDADRMLFDAGRASVRPGKPGLLWPVAAGCLSLLAAVLAVGLIHQREENRALVRQLEARPAPALPASVPAPPSGPLVWAESPDAYMALRRALEQDPDDWPEPRAGGPAGPGSTSPVILRACDREAFLQP
jgi:hypothetical protein